MCNKIRFSSRAQAKAWAREALARSATGSLRPYECPVCEPGTWHLTSKYTARDNRRIARAHRRAS